MHIRIPAGSRKSILTRMALELWRAGRLDVGGLLQARGRLVTEGGQALRVLLRTSTADLEQAVLTCLNGDVVEVEGPLEVLGTPERELLRRLGVELSHEDPAGGPPDEAKEPVRFIDMTRALLGLAAVVMALRYLALGMSDRELYVMAGIGYAAFVLIRTFSYRLKRPKNAPAPELD